MNFDVDTIGQPRVLCGPTGSGGDPMCILFLTVRRTDGGGWRKDKQTWGLKCLFKLGKAQLG